MAFGCAQRRNIPVIVEKAAIKNIQTHSVGK